MGSKSLRRPFAPPQLTKYVSFPDELGQWVEHEAQRRAVSQSKVIQDCIAAQRTMQQELGEPQLLHEILSRVKAELITTFSEQQQEIQRLSRDLRALTILLDRAVLLYLNHTPTVPEEQRPTQRAEAARRYEAWLREAVAVLEKERQT